MKPLRQAQQFEYRSAGGIDRMGVLDLWLNDGGTRAVLVLRDVPVPDATRALRMLNEHWLPYLLPAGLDVLVLAVHPQAEGEKARARVLPLSA